MSVDLVARSPLIKRAQGTPAKGIRAAVLQEVVARQNRVLDITVRIRDVMNDETRSTVDTEKELALLWQDYHRARAAVDQKMEELPSLKSDPGFPTQVIREIDANWKLKQCIFTMFPGLKPPPVRTPFPPATNSLAVPPKASGDSDKIYHQGTRDRKTYHGRNSLDGKDWNMAISWCDGDVKYFTAEDDQLEISRNPEEEISISFKPTNGGEALGQPLNEMRSRITDFSTRTFTSELGDSLNDRVKNFFAPDHRGRRGERPSPNVGGGAARIRIPAH